MFLKRSKGLIQDSKYHENAAVKMKARDKRHKIHVYNTDKDRCYVIVLNIYK